MTDNQIETCDELCNQMETCDELWREALEAGLVRWMPGMRTHWGWRALLTAGSRCLAASDSEGLCVWRETHDWLVDWTDPATIGCLLAMAREATGDAWLHAVLSGPFMGGADWTTRGRGSRFVTGGVYAHTEPEALLRAILSARGER